MGNNESSGVKQNRVKFKHPDQRLAEVLEDFDFEEEADQFSAPEGTPTARPSQGKANAYIDEEGNFS